MSTDERRQEIINYLMKNNTVSVNSIIELLPSSPATVRRDLDFLEKNGSVTRSRGYVKFKQPVVVRTIKMTDEKIAVAKAAAAMIPQGATISLDSGASTLALANQLVNRDDLTIYTNSLSVLNVMAFSTIPTYCAGGILDGRQEAFLGPDAESYIRNLHIPILFLSTTGIRKTQGLVCVTPLQASMKRAFIESSELVVLLADATKFKTDSVRVFAKMSEIDTIITDEPLNDSEFEHFLEQIGTKLIVANHMQEK